MEEDEFTALTEKARRRALRAAENLSEEEWAVDAQFLKLMEEVGEAAGEYQACTGRARHRGNFNALKTELADVYITLKVLSKLLDIDLEDAVASKLVEIQRRGGI